MLYDPDEFSFLFSALHLEGNIIPPSWLKKVRLKDGTPDTVACFILSEIVYWYRPIHLKDEKGNPFIQKKYKSDLLQKSYDDLASSLGFSKRQCQDAMARLEQAGIVKRIFRTLKVDGLTLANVLFIKPNFEKIRDITLIKNDKSEGYHVQTGQGVSRSNGTPSTLERETNTEITHRLLNNKKGPTHVVLPSPDAEVLFQFFLQKIKEGNPKFKNPNSKKWIEELDRMIRLDKRSIEDIKKVIEWSRSADWYKSNVLSPESLRKQFDKMWARMNEIQEKDKREGKIKPQVPCSLESSIENIERNRKIAIVAESKLVSCFTSTVFMECGNESVTLINSNKDYEKEFKFSEWNSDEFKKVLVQQLKILFPNAEEKLGLKSKISLNEQLAKLQLSEQKKYEEALQ